MSDGFETTWASLSSKQVAEITIPPETPQPRIGDTISIRRFAAISVDARGHLIVVLPSIPEAILGEWKVAARNPDGSFTIERTT